MNRKALFLTCAFATILAVTANDASAVDAGCKIADAKLEEGIARKTELRQGANGQVVRDLRTLRDAAIILDSYQQDKECTRLVRIVQALVANPERAVELSGDTDEDKADAIDEARTPKVTGPQARR